MTSNFRLEIFSVKRMHTIIPITASFCEIGILSLAGFVLFRQWDYTFAEAAAYAIITMLMALSFIFQTAFIIGIPALSLKAEVILCLMAVIILISLRGHLIMGGNILKNFATAYPGACMALFTACCYLLIRGILLSPMSSHWDGLGSILSFRQHGNFFAFPKGDDVLFPVNHIVLTHLILRLNTEFGMGILGFMAYLSIGFSTYALARRYSWPPTAFIVTMVVMSMPRLVCQAVSPGDEIIPAAVSLFCFLGISRSVEQPNIKDLLLLTLGILFGISSGTTSVVFPVILILLSCVLFIRRHGSHIWWTLLTSNKLASVLALLPGIIFSQCWLFLFNILYRGAWVGSSADSPPNTDGLQGALANFFRYVLESAHFTQPLDLLCQWMMHFRLSAMVQQIYDLFVWPVFGDWGAAAPFVINWKPDESLSWFGPLAFLLILPAVIYTLIRGHRRIKAMAVALMGYFYVVTLTTAWMPGNARFFTLFYTCGGFCVAFLLPPWRFTKRGKQVIQAGSAVLLFYACVCI